VVFTVKQFDENENIRDLINTFLYTILGMNCKLIKCDNGKTFNNTSPLLVCNENSLIDLNLKISHTQKQIQSQNQTQEQKQKTILSLLYDTTINVVQYITSFFTSLSPSSPNIVNDDDNKNMIGFERFRPNIIVSNMRPYEEDNIREIKLVKNEYISFIKDQDCNRCYNTTINIKERMRDSYLEPMKTLLTYRKVGNKVIFGSLFNINLSYKDKESEIIVNIGDIEIKY